MNVWAWVQELADELSRSGQADVAAKLHRLPELALKGDHERVEAVATDLLATAKAIDSPWMEVYARHWWLQSRAAQRGEGRAVLTDAVEAFERANREDARDCPQTICTTQDLAICYSNVDGPGYVRERLDVVDETMERIDPTWSCFNCLVSERVTALLDAGRVEEALEAHRAGRRRQAAAHAVPDPEVLVDEPDVLLRMGQAQAALDVLDSPRVSAVGRRSNWPGVRWRVVRALALAQLGRFDEAAASLPPFKVVQSHGRLGHRRWLDAVELLVDAGRFDNAPPLSDDLDTMLLEQVRMGAPRRAAEIALVVARLAMQREARSTARWALDVAEREAQGVRDPQPIVDAARELRARLSRLAPAALPVPASDVTKYVHDNADTLPHEAALDMLEAAAAERPDDVDLLEARVMVLVGRGRGTEAAALLEGTVEQQAYDRRRANMLANALLAADRDDDLLQLARRIEPDDPAMAHAMRGRLHFVRGRMRECVVEAEQAMAADPTMKGTRRMWAAAARNLGDWTTAVRVLRELLRQGDVDNRDRWALTVAATAARDWTTARETAIALGMQVDPDGEEFTEPFGGCVVSSTADGGEQRDFAQRLGPAMAQVVSVALPHQRCRAGDVVVVEPTALEPVPQDEEAQRRFLPTFAEVAVLRRAECLPFTVAGAVPDFQVWGELYEAIRERGWHVWVHSGEDYKVLDGDVPLTAVWARIAVPPDVPLTDVDAFLSERVAGWPVRPCWPELAAAAGGDAALHGELWERYDLDY